MQKFYITTAIDYVNATPHIGHAYEKVAADVLARHNRIRGKEVFFLTGIDEHGSKVEKQAQLAAKPPKLFCDEMSTKFLDAWKALDLSFNYFIRTTEARHARVTQEVFRRARSKGDIYKAQYVGLYCDGCEDFKRERDLNENGHCPLHKVPPKKIEEENFFFRLSKYKPIIKEKILANELIVRPEARRKEVLNQLDDPELGDFSISRSRHSLTWGIPLVDEADQVIYVWLDALSNYITGVGFDDNAELFKLFWPADLHLVGKDIMKFHCIYWPAFLLAADIELPRQIYGHGFLTVEGQKISKSLGNVIDPVALAQEFGSDAVRFFLLAGTSFDQDGDFSRAALVRRVNADLANNLGNLLNRTITLAERNCAGRVPAAEMHKELQAAAAKIYLHLDLFMSQLEFVKCIEAILALTDRANVYLNNEKPWALFKEGKREQGEVVLYTVLEILRQVAIDIYPFTPKLSAQIWHQLGYDYEISEVGNRADTPIIKGQTLRNTGPVFKRIEDIDLLIAK